MPSATHCRVSAGIGNFQGIWQMAGTQKTSSFESNVAAHTPRNICLTKVTGRNRKRYWRMPILQCSMKAVELIEKGKKYRSVR